MARTVKKTTKTQKQQPKKTKAISKPTKSSAKKLPVSYQDVCNAAKRLKGVANRTPVMTSRTLDKKTGAKFFLKCENFQRIGAFKFRGGYNALAQFTA